MKKFLAVLAALVLAVVPVLSLAEETAAARQVNVDIEANEDLFSGLLGEEAGKAIAETLNSLGVTVTGSQAGMLMEETMGEGTLYTVAAEAVDNLMYFATSLLPYTFVLDAGTVTNLLSGATTGEVTLDLGMLDGLMEELSSVELSASNTMSAVLGLMFNVEYKDDGSLTLTLTPDDLTAVLDAVAADAQETKGLDELVEKYTGVKGATDALVAGIATLKEQVTQVVTDSILFINDADGNMQLSVPTANATLLAAYEPKDEDGLTCAELVLSTDESAIAFRIRTDNVSVAVLDEQVTTRNEADELVYEYPFALKLDWNLNSFEVTLSSYDQVAAALAATWNDLGWSASLNSGDTGMDVSFEKEEENKYLFTLLMDGLELKCEATKEEGMGEVLLSLNDVVALKAVYTVSEVAAPAAYVADKENAVSLLELLMDSDALQSMLETLNANMDQALNDCVQYLPQSMQDLLNSANTTVVAE